MTVLRFAQFLPTVLVGIALVSALREPSKPVCRCVPREVGASGSRVDWPGYTQGIRWHYSVDEAMEIARAQRRLVFWYHVVGDLDKEGC